MLTARDTCTSGTLDALASLDFGLAVTPAEREDAFRLVHDQYVARGYMRPDPSGRRAGRHHLLPSTRVFVARADGRVVATVSVIPDSAVGLPCDDLYRDELTPLRAGGRRLAEVSALAVDDRWRDVGLPIIRSLVQMVAVYASRIERLQTLCIAVNPRHARFYETLLRFERFSTVKAYAAVNGAPAVALKLDLQRELAAPVTDAATFAPALFDPRETARLLARLHRDLARGAGGQVQLFQSVASADHSVRRAEHFAAATPMEVC